LRVRERLDAVEMPLKRTNQSQKARQPFFGVSFVIGNYLPLPAGFGVDQFI
jgi:hypothetical protein